MALKRLVVAALALLPLLGIGAALRARLSPDASEAYREALSLSSRGQSSKAVALLQSQLLASGVTIGIVDGSDEYAEALEDALDIWRRHLADSPLRAAEGSRRPDVAIRFANRLEDGNDIQGKIDVERELFWGGGRTGYKVRGEIVICRRVDWRTLERDEAAEVIAHELGHLLGLDDRDEERGLMGPFVPGRPRLRPSEDEIDALTAYRSDLRQALGRMAGRSK